jgi:hypothetical protein
MRYTSRFTLNLEPATMEALHALAEQSGVPAGILVRSLIQRFVANPSLFSPLVHADSEQYAGREEAIAATSIGRR